MESFPKSLSRTKFCCWWWLFSFYEGLNYLEEAFETGHFMIKLSSKRFGPYIFHSQLNILSALRLFQHNIFDEIFWLFWIWPTSTTHTALIRRVLMQSNIILELRRDLGQVTNNRSTSLDDQQFTKNHINGHYFILHHGHSFGLERKYIQETLLSRICGGADGKSRAIEGGGGVVSGD